VGYVIGMETITLKGETIESERMILKLVQEKFGVQS